MVDDKKPDKTLQKSSKLKSVTDNVIVGVLVTVFGTFLFGFVSALAFFAIVARWLGPILLIFLVWAVLEHQELVDLVDWL